jgi:hypothetical protein
LAEALRLLFTYYQRNVFETGTPMAAQLQQRVQRELSASAAGLGRAALAFVRANPCVRYSAEVLRDLNVAAAADEEASMSDANLDTNNSSTSTGSRSGGSGDSDWTDDAKASPTEANDTSNADDAEPAASGDRDHRDEEEKDEADGREQASAPSHARSWAEPARDLVLARVLQKTKLLLRQLVARLLPVSGRY